MMVGATTGKAITNVVVVEDDADARLCLFDILQESGVFNCIGTFSNAADALADIPLLLPDLVLMDIRLPGLSGIECTRRLKHLLPSLKIVMVTGMHDDNSIQNSLNAGAIAYLVKPVVSEQYLTTLKCVMATDAFPIQHSSNAKQGQRPSAVLETSSLLTNRENEVMRHFAEGLLYKEIADKMNISYSAVHKLQHKIFVKLRAGNRTEAILKWRASLKHFTDQAQ